MKIRLASLTLAASLFSLPALAADKITFKDPRGDDNGPGTYVYPTDTVYKKGSFDLTKFVVEKDGDNVEFTSTMGAKIENPWNMKQGFSTQMLFIFIDTDGKEGSGHTEGLPGLNLEFSPSSAWEKVIIVSPQESARVKNEVETKAASLKDAIVVPGTITVRGNNITALVKASALGEGDPSQWGFQVVVQSNEGFPQGGDLLTRKVNEYEGQHRFGGGHEAECDPHVIDLLAGSAKGDKSEVKAQHEMLKYECGAEGIAKSKAKLTMVRASK